MLVKNAPSYQTQNRKRNANQRVYGPKANKELVQVEYLSMNRLHAIQGPNGKPHRNAYDNTDLSKHQAE